MLSICLVIIWFIVTVREVSALYKRKEIDVVKIQKDKALKLIECYINNSLDGYGFEDFMEYVFDHAGYEVIKTQRSRDGGKDLILNCDTYVELKHYTGKSMVGGEIVKKLYATCVADNIDKAIIITTNRYTRDAIALMDKYTRSGVSIERWYTEDIMNMISEEVNVGLLLQHIGYKKG